MAQRRKREMFQHEYCHAIFFFSGYKDNSPKGPIDLVGSGDGDLSELKALLSADAPMYGLYRVTDNVDDITTVKFVYIVW